MPLDNGTVACFWRNNGKYFEIGFNKNGGGYWYAKLSESSKSHRDDPCGSDLYTNDEIFCIILDLANEVTTG
jgi:hypothetical protein